MREVQGSALAHLHRRALERAGVEKRRRAEVGRTADRGRSPREDRVVAGKPDPVEVVEAKRRRAVRHVAPGDDGVGGHLRLLEADARGVAAHGKPTHVFPVAATIDGSGRAAFL